MHMDIGSGWWKEGMGVWDQQRQTIIYRMDKKQDHTVQHRNYIQYSVTNHNGKKHEKEYIYTYICITESLCCTEEINKTL